MAFVTIFPSLRESEILEDIDINKYLSSERQCVRHCSGHLMTN